MFMHEKRKGGLISLSKYTFLTHVVFLVIYAPSGLSEWISGQVGLIAEYLCSSR